MALIHFEGPGESSDFSIAYSPDSSSHLLGIAHARFIRLWDTERLQDVRTIKIDDEYRCSEITFSRDGVTVLADIRRREDNAGELWLWKVSDGTRLKRFSSVRNSQMYAMQFSPDGKTVAAIGDQDQVVTFDLATGNELDVLPDVRAAASPLVFSPDGRTLTTISGEQTLHFWDRSTGKDRLATPDSHHDFIQFLAFSPGGETLVSFSRDRTIRFWNLTTGRLSKVFPHDGSLLSVAFPAGGTPLGAGLDGSGQAGLESRNRHSATFLVGQRTRPRSVLQRYPAEPRRLNRGRITGRWFTPKLGYRDRQRALDPPTEVARRTRSGAGRCRQLGIFATAIRLR